MSNRTMINLFALFVGLMVGITCCMAFADQPATTATEGEHLYFLENLLVVICNVLFGLLGAWSGYAVTRKHDKVNL